MSELAFYSAAIHTFANTGNEILQMIDDILSGDLVWFGDQQDDSSSDLN